MKIVAIIPARGGSKRVPNKNIKKLLSKPLIAYTIESALKSKKVDRVIVSTDDKEISEISKKYGAEVPFIRPLYLATDTAHTPPVIKHAVEFLEKNEGYKVDVLVTLQATSPLRTAKQIDEAIDKFLKENVDSLVSIKEADFPPFWLFKIEKNKLVPFIQKKGINYFLKESQELPKVYQPNGAIYITKKSLLLKKCELMGGKISGYLMDHKSSLDVDNLLDLKFIELVMKNEKNKNRR